MVIENINSKLNIFVNLIKFYIEYLPSGILAQRYFYIYLFHLNDIVILYVIDL